MWSSLFFGEQFRSGPLPPALCLPLPQYLSVPYSFFCDDFAFCYFFCGRLPVRSSYTPPNALWFDHKKKPAKKSSRVLAGIYDKPKRLFATFLVLRLIMCLFVPKSKIFIFVQLFQRHIEQCNRDSISKPDDFRRKHSCRRSSEMRIKRGGPWIYPLNFDDISN